jgi:hypothetical protein
VIARRCITLMYATIGLMLVTFSETVKRAKARHRAERAVTTAPEAALPLAIVVTDEPGEVSPS